MESRSLQAQVTFLRNGCTEIMNCTVKNTIRTMLLHSDAPADLWPECLYAVYIVHNCIVQDGQLKTPKELLTVIKLTVAELIRLDAASGLEFWIKRGKFLNQMLFLTFYCVVLR